MKFNINNIVKVRLTDYGYKCLADDHEELFHGTDFEYRPRAEDADGWSHWQLHDLMSSLGKYISLGSELPFEPDIEIA